MWYIANGKTGFSFGNKKKTPSYILKQRLAKGEIAEEAFKKKNAILKDE